MNRYVKTGVVLSLALIGAGCDSFIQGPGLTESPNSPTIGTARQQLVSVQARMATLLEGQLARTAGMYTQQIVGQNNQQLTAMRYLYTESDYSGFFSGFYVGGGLVAMRNIQQIAQTEGDDLMRGIALVWEGLAMGTATSIWGDLPYSEAINPEIATPRLDPQEQVYAAVQQKLDDGIAALQAAGSTGSPELGDLVYCPPPGCDRATQVAKWIAAAYTMKARFHLDLVERNGNAAYTAALAAAANGIAIAPIDTIQARHGEAAGDFRLFHGAVQNLDANVWAGFLAERGGDIRAGNVLVQLLKDRSDPRLSAYFAPNGAGEYYGLDRNAAVVGGPASEVNISKRRQFTFRQPIVTWAENQLIQAEAKFVLTGAAAALPHVNAVREAVGMPALAAVTFQDVMLEKYIAMFQNIAVWSDYKRTCIPTVAPNGTNPEIPGRLPYGSGERTTNPFIPLPNAYPSLTTGASPLRNWNDPNPCA